METVRKFVQDNRLVVGGTVGVLALVTGLFLWQKGTKSSTMTPNPNTSNHRTVIPADNPLDFDAKFINLIKDLQQKLIKSGEVLSPEIMKDIYRGQYYLAAEQSKKIIKQSREERREKIASRYDYVQTILKYEKQLEEELEKHLNGILAHFNIDKQIWIEETTKWSTSSEEADEEWQQLIQQEEEKLQESLRNPSLKHKSFKQIKAILEYKIKNLEVMSEEDLGLDLGQDDNAKYTIIQTSVQDKVYEKFRVEEELLEYSISLLNEKQKEELEELYEKISDLYGDFFYEGGDLAENDEDWEDEEDEEDEGKGGEGEGEGDDSGEKYDEEEDQECYY